MASYPNVNDLNRYARDVVTGKILACRYVKLSCQRHLDDLEKSKDPTGLSSAAVADTITGGTNIEDVEQWRARIMDRWYYVPQSGADPDYVVWAESIQEVARAWTYRNYDGDGSVGVMITTDNVIDPTPTQDTIDQVVSYITPLSPVAGSRLFVFGPTIKKIDFTITLYPDNDSTRNAVISEIQSYLSENGEPNSTLYLSNLDEVISEASGESHHVMVAPSADILLGDYELPVAGVFTWTS